MSFSRAKIFAITALIALLFVGFFSIGMGNMDMNKDGGMSGCIFTGKIMPCDMNIVEHISLWQNMFTAMPTKNIISFLFFLAIFVIMFSVLRKNILTPPLSEYFSLKQYQRRKPKNFSFNSVKYALAKGVLHPKIYELAYL